MIVCKEKDLNSVEELEVPYGIPESILAYFVDSSFKLLTGDRNFVKLLDHNNIPYTDVYLAKGVH